MPARTQPLVISKDRFGNRGVEADKRNFELNNDPNGLANAIGGLNRQDAADQARTGPVMAQNQSGVQAQAMGQIAQRSRAEEGDLANALGLQALGMGYNPALAQLAASTQAAQANQRSLAAGESGYNMAAANREAAWQNQALAAQGEQQGRVLGAQMQAFGRDQYAGLADAMRAQDLTTRGAMQQDAARQAQLSDEQRARNDAMAAFYLGEQDRLRRAQTGANVNFEQQDASNKLGVSNQNMGRQAFDQQLTNRYAGMALSMGGTGLAGASTYATSGNDGTPSTAKKKRDPEDPFADY